jgi:peptidoglycan hydrolase FlgJ
MDVMAIPTAALPPADAQLPSSLWARRQPGSDPAQAKKVGQEFEAMFVGLMLKSMRDTVGKDKLTGGGHGEEAFRSMLDQQYAQEASHTGGIGLAKMLQQELTRGTAAPAVAKGSGNAD